MMGELTCGMPLGLRLCIYGRIHLVRFSWDVRTNASITGQTTESRESSQRAGATGGNAAHMTKPITKKPSRGRAKIARLRRISDAEIARTSPPELAALPADFWNDAAIVVPTAKTAISLRVDQDVLAWFRTSGPRYQTRMNAVLRSYVAAMSAGRRKSRARPT